MLGSRSITRRALTFVTVAIAAVVGTASASATGNPGLLAPGGCASQCIKSAIVTTTSTTAKAKILTSLRTSVVLTARRVSTAGGLVAGPPDASVSHHLLRKRRTLFLLGLQPRTTYRIFVSARDAEGRTDSRDGTFSTRPVATNVDPGAGTISSGLGCSLECIRKAVPVEIGPTAAVFEFGTNTPARMQLVVSRDAGAHDVVSNSSSVGYVTTWTAGPSLLAPGTTYFLSIRATDTSGRTSERHWTFQTDEQNVRVTLWKIKVISDADKGIARGELTFDYWAGGELVGGEDGFHKRSSGDVVTVHAPGTTRPGLTVVLPANGSTPTLDVRVYGEECDGPAQMKNCVRESREQGWIPSGGGDFAGNDTATAGGLFSLGAILATGALPSNFGTSMPPGHDGYFAFETTEHHLKFRVYAFLDVFYA